MNIRHLSLFLSFLFFTLSYAVAKPKNIIIIRHAEKVPGKDYLDLKGFERASSLGHYFSGTSLYNNPPISHIFAAAPKQNSIRPVQTCTPIAHHYNLPLHTDFKNNEPEKIARELLTNAKYDYSTVLICWSHGHIRPIVLALGAEDPGFWDKDIYDQVYLITFETDKNPKLQKILQKLMLGDRTKI